MIVNLWMGFDDLAKSSAEPGGPDDSGHNSFRHLGDPTVRDIYRHHDETGPRTYEMWSLFYEVEDSNEVLDIRNDLLADFPGQLRTIGSWLFDTGQQVLNLAGTQPLFPLHTTILEYMPDIVTFDEDGNEVSRSRPTVPSDVNLGLGQSTRQF